MFVEFIIGMLYLIFINLSFQLSFEADKNANMVSGFSTLSLVIALFAESGVDGKLH